MNYLGCAVNSKRLRLLIDKENYSLTYNTRQPFLTIASVVEETNEDVLPDKFRAA